jgi:alpha-1,2-mannosyltransferase
VPAEARPRLSAIGWVALGVAVAFCVHYLTRAATAYLLDLDVYRDATEVAWAGGDLYGLRYTDVGLPYLYPPFAVLFLTPLVWVSQAGAQVIWTLITLASVVLYAVVCVWNFAADRYHTWTVYLVTIAFALVMEPTESNINFGQVNILLAAFLVLDISARTGRLPQGVLTGVAAAVKLTPLLVAVYYLVTRRVRPALWTIGSFVACSALAAAVFPKISWIYWTGTFLEADRVGVAYISNQSINAALQRALDDPDLARLGWLALGGLCALAVLIVAHHLFGTYPHLTDALVLAAILLVSPISWTAHWILILPLLLVAVFPDAPAVLLRVLAGALALALLYGVVRPTETAQSLPELPPDNLLLANTFTWLTLALGIGCTIWYWRRVPDH